MTLLQQMAREKTRRREALRLATQVELREALRALLPCQRVIVFGSLVKPGRFSEDSDIDLAIEREPSDVTICQLIGILGDRLGRRVDIVLLEDCRFRDRILREGKAWTLPG